MQSTLIRLGARRRTATDRVRGIIDTRDHGTDGGIRDTVGVVTSRPVIVWQKVYQLAEFRMTSWEAKSPGVDTVHITRLLETAKPPIDTHCFQILVGGVLTRDDMTVESLIGFSFAMFGEKHQSDVYLCK